MASAHSLRQRALAPRAMPVFQAELRPAKVLRHLVDALKEVVSEVTFECSEAAVTAQAMDSSHVSLVSLELDAAQFQAYRCEKTLSLGVNVGNLAKMLKCAAPDDTVRLRAEDDGDTLGVRIADPQDERISEFSMKLIEIDGDSLGIPNQRYGADVRMPSSEFTRICKDIGNFGDTVTIEVKKDAVSFAAQGDIGTGRMVLKAGRWARAKAEGAAKEEAAVKKEKSAEGAEDQKQRSAAGAAAGAAGAAGAAAGDSAGAAGAGGGPARKRRRGAAAGQDGAEAAPAERDGAKEQQQVSIDCSEPVVLQFALRYLGMFSRAQSVSDTVHMRLSKDVPLQLEFEVPAVGAAAAGRLGLLRYYLAPKVGDDDGDEPAAADDE